MSKIKLNIINAIVVLGLVAASMLMPMVAANLADSQSVSQTTTSYDASDITG